MQRPVRRLPLAGELSTRSVTIAIIFLMLAVTWLQFFQWPMPVTGGIDHRDSGVFAFGGWVLAHGGRPYLDFWDQKPPAVFLLNDWAIRLAGMRMVGAWWLSLSALLLSVPLAWTVLKRWTRDASAALMATALATLSIVGVLQGGNSIELYSLPVRWLGILVLLAWLEESRPARRYLLLAAGGFLAGILITLRQNEVLTAVGILGGVAWEMGSRKKWREVANLFIVGTAGILVVLLVMTVWLSKLGVFSLFWEEVVRYNFDYKLSATFLQRLDAFGAIFDFMPLYALVLGGWIALATGKVRPYHTWGVREKILMLTFPLDLMMVLLSGQRYPHYFISLLPLAGLMTAYILEQVNLARGEKRVRIRKGIWGLAVILLLLTGVKFAGKWYRPIHSMRGNVVREVAHAIRSEADPDDRLFIWGMVPELYVKAGLPVSNRFTHVYPFLSPGYTDSSVVQKLLTSFRKQPPTWILDASSHNGRIPTLSSWQPGFRVYGKALDPSLKAFYREVAKAYTPVDTLTSWNWILYRRKTSLP